ncbi:hypothetical protein G7K_3645-t1 [Saitoella complicata NRRL Y-17804]|uniref:Uncharacterized protein n=1 Tax=Saitoella complicata (strain BCRC 22490 / CBS 7301 / JCM 7358 / NBRC 10748 / NRRL Y-17804) TaxID=698492 RepID=A0A0E9NIJ6_SAICN|nr:hypothetical protein G7K_3645-t1 [Saitoella complicata NRRL Y-17804]
MWGNFGASLGKSADLLLWTLSIRECSGQEDHWQRKEVKQKVNRSIARKNVLNVQNPRLDRTHYSNASTLKVLLDGLLEVRSGSTDNLNSHTHLSNLLTVLEQQEGGHGADVVLGSDLGELIDVDLDELGVGVGVGELGDLGGNGLARTAPGGKAAVIALQLTDNGQLGTSDGGVELLSGRDKVDHFGRSGGKSSDERSLVLKSASCELTKESQFCGLFGSCVGQGEQQI